ncbi:tRNA (adenosine(37)-N6)-dimethylallyltransferase MiaA [Riemerella anatipestifer]|uniref:tRNA (adenosine(37)-N6)-dimethylallyltransferase MiaA n=1 Tax=Riemerella anatipestifer TaxID=34085 RepID=UPI00208EF1AB|nr:tRNA (adenosine(37)-N6)-dimethylallyltransferase MiaA [Riemerella anatipestifer]MCO4303964.1 tRNA (adenosine(37)-N6)-dimethylallyltransferase MiaA [Riemerella anatipestifer]MCO7352542.1 tRNA (adenosine(37)-N6)-dimethylallyltransferase MiaA [Riemerella anatipestifer]MCQ4039268.1 tRNA (adenosine(37)-N6)-dimethylallyltransferase MiaA [Riemerella anatipestifer]MCT6760934.1 tRNA (adenosine(37)-N6)-dimethylallyltransferase MiaA [Riemerella anatipestifer]MCT6765129.1 tRNA (adenosine(37)-N6)-dimeth
MARTLISVVGPTGIGKTELAIKIAQFFGTEILSCDSRQFFKEMPIGTAAPSKEELAIVPHHFIGHLSITEDYSIGRYEKEVLALLDKLFQKYKVVVMVGGSGMYEKAVVEGLNDLPEANEDCIKELEQILNKEGIEALQKQLEAQDEAYYQQVDKDNPRRLIRALDIIKQTGKPYSEIIAETKPKRDFNTIRIVLTAPREIIYERINQRVDRMMEKGLLDEVKGLLQYQDRVALNTVGYTELFNYLNGDWELDFAVSEIKKNSRRYAKRQMTWNRKLPHLIELSHQYSKEELVSLLNNLNLK